MQIKLIIPGPPIAKARARTTVRYDKDKKPYVFWYDPQAKEAKAYRAGIHTLVYSNPVFPIQGAVALNILYLLPRPMSHHGSGRNRANLKPSAPRVHVVKPDLDNLVKFTKDGLNKLAYNDDRQVVTIWADKMYGPEPKTIIRIAEVGTG